MNWPQNAPERILSIRIVSTSAIRMKCFTGQDPCAPLRKTFGSPSLPSAHSSNASANLLEERKGRAPRARDTGRRPYGYRSPTITDVPRVAVVLLPLQGKGWDGDGSSVFCPLNQRARRVGQNPTCSS